MADVQAPHAHPHPHPHPPVAAAQQAGPPPGPPPAQLAASATILDAVPVNTVPFALLPQLPRVLPPNLPPNVQAPPPPLPKLVCPEHQLEKCGNCTASSSSGGSGSGSGQTGVDFERINRLGYFMAFLAPGMVPPPPNVQFGKNADAIKQIREKGNTAFQSRPPAYTEAIKLYTQSINGSFSRPLWESAGFTKDEVVAALLNRNAAFAGLGDWPAAYADADASIKLDTKKSKGYFRKGKALVEMSRLEEAHEVVSQGLQFDGTNEELIDYAKKLKEQIDAATTTSSVAASIPKADLAGGSEKAGSKEEKEKADGAVAAVAPEESEKAGT